MQFATSTELRAVDEADDFKDHQEIYMQIHVLYMYKNHYSRDSIKQRTALFHIMIEGCHKEPNTNAKLSSSCLELKVYLYLLVSIYQKA